MASDSEFKACPKCRDGVGVPKSVGSSDQPTFVVITVQCDRCHHVWRYERESIIKLGPKADRRKTPL